MAPVIAILGTGRMGTSLGVALRHAGYRVLFGSSNPEGARRRLHASRFDVTDSLDASRRADVAMLALTWDATAKLPHLRRVLHGKVVISCTNAETGGGLVIPPGLSATETIASVLPGARVVAAFNHIYAELLAGVPFDGGLPSVLVCGDDPDAVAVASMMAAALGFEAVHAGGIERAGLVESVAALMVTLVRERGMPPDSIALRLMSQVPISNNVGCDCFAACAYDQTRSRLERPSSGATSAAGRAGPPEASRSSLYHRRRA
jgi:predicted dinucleotide-binding enzyme